MQQQYGRYSKLMWWRKSVDAHGKVCESVDGLTSGEDLFLSQYSCKVTEIQILTHINVQEHQEMNLDELLKGLICLWLFFDILDKLFEKWNNFLK